MLRRSGANPDWEGYLLSLQEVLVDILDSIKEDAECNVSSDVSCLSAFDTLEQWLHEVKQELGL